MVFDEGTLLKSLSKKNVMALEVDDNNWLELSLTTVKVNYTFIQLAHSLYRRKGSK